MGWLTLPFTPVSLLAAPGTAHQRLHRHLMHEMPVGDLRARHGRHLVVGLHLVPRRHLRGGCRFGLHGVPLGPDGALGL